jgi:hypothetical protein
MVFEGFVNMDYHLSAEVACKAINKKVLKM